jgi:hypothetical protein
MKKILKITIVVLVMAAGSIPFPGGAFTPATHVYITAKVARQVFPFTFDRIDLYYGSIAPDLSSYATPENWPNGFCETHYEYIRLHYAWCNPIQKAFVQGWQIHNEKQPWGADFYAHGTCFDCNQSICTDDGYVPMQALALARAIFELYGNDMLLKNLDLAHFAIEVAIDLLLIDNQDHHLGEKLFWSALLRSSEDVSLLAKTFVGQPDDIGTDLQALISAESTFRNLVINYAWALSLPEPERMELLRDIGVQIASELGVIIEPATVQLILEAAAVLCSGSYYDPVDAAIQGIIMNKSHLIK